MPKVHKLGSDGIYDLAFPKQAGKEAAEGWWASNASPDMLSDKKADEWINEVQDRSSSGSPPTTRSPRTTACMVIADAIERTVKAGKPVNRVERP